jgi:hypothetical protein
MFWSRQPYLSLETALTASSPPASGDTLAPLFRTSQGEKVA